MILNIIFNKPDVGCSLNCGWNVAALVVRFITRRFIGEYDPTLEKVYTFHTVMDNDMVYFEILDTAGQPHVSSLLLLFPRFPVTYNCQQQF